MRPKLGRNDLGSVALDCRGVLEGESVHADAACRYVYRDNQIALQWRSDPTVPHIAPRRPARGGVRASRARITRNGLIPANASQPNATQPQDAAMHPAGVQEEVDELMAANPWIGGGGMKPRSGSGRGGAAAPAARGGGRGAKFVKTKRPSQIRQRRANMSPSQR